MAVATGDFNGDGKLDLVVLTGCGTGPCVSILLGNGDGTFQAHIDYPAGTGDLPTSLAVADLNGDGKLDLAVTNQSSDAVSVLLGNGDGTFQPYAAYGAGGSPMSVADFNGDGKLDLAVVNSSGVSIFLNKGDGTFPSTQDFSTAPGPTSVTTGDFNGDGKLDLAVTAVCASASNCTGAGVVCILLGNGADTFQACVDYPVGIDPVWITAEDLNGDGNLDLAVANEGTGGDGVPSGSSVMILWGNGDGTFAGQTFTAGNGPDWVGVGDFNGDGRLDFACRERYR